MFIARFPTPWSKSPAAFAKPLTALAPKRTADGAPDGGCWAGLDRWRPGATASGLAASETRKAPKIGRASVYPGYRVCFGMK
jgi:hypothetical protein